jgi:hypothetical protein
MLFDTLTHHRTERLAVIIAARDQVISGADIVANAGRAKGVLSRAGDIFTFCLCSFDVTLLTDASAEGMAAMDAIDLRDAYAVLG